MQIYSVTLGFQCGSFYPVLFEALIFVIESLKGNVRACSELLQEISLPVLRFTLQLKASLELLFLFTLPIGVVEFAVPGTAFIILIAWHIVISPFTPWGGVNNWKK